ncbi:hypothetical protein [Neomicrococcus lactis]|uniref:hypothetical protein n=1 Tax=Neomicrococcus lactis TaxID=732241 RepID=UPI0023014DCE|nr:hypothetical protein [Neomicrococcus lactis]
MNLSPEDLESLKDLFQPKPVEPEPITAEPQTGPVIPRQEVHPELAPQHTEHERAVNKLFNAGTIREMY